MEQYDLGTVEWRVAFDLFERWQSAPTEDRPAVLQRLVEERPDLAAALQALVRSDAAATRDPSGLSLLLPASDRAGATIGAWRLQRLLGSGGMGEVWLAQRDDALYHGQAAIKLLQSHQRSPAAQARFAAEARLLARLTHPHIARLLDVGIDGAGQRHLVLEFVAGEPIDRWCAARDAPVAERLRLFLQVCDAVSHAHAQLVVHRDLKPSNILVDGEGQAKLLDFGVAKLLDDSEEGITRTGLLVLTPEYAAPEQLVGEPVSVAADVYALGVVLFELLCGQRPHAGGTTSLAAWKHRLESEPRRLRTLAPALHGDLDAIAAKALQPAPADRYLSVLALADDLKRHLAHEPVLAASQTLAYRLRKLVRRHRGTVAAGTFAAAALLAGGGLAIWQAVQARHAAAVARAEADKAQGARDFLLGLFGAYDAGSSDSQQYREMSVRQALEAAGRKLLGTRDQPPAVRLDLLVHLGRLHVLLGMEEAGARMEQEAWALTREVHDRRSVAYVLASLSYGTNLATAGQIDAGLERLQEAIDLTAGPGFSDDAWSALSYKQFGLVCEMAGDPRAPAYLAQAIERFASWGAHDERVSAHTGMMRWHLQGEDFDAFDREATRTAALVARSERHFIFDRYAYEAELASRWLLAGDLARSRDALARALPAVESGMGRDHPRAVRVRRQLALLDLRIGDRDAAQRQLAELAARPLHRRFDEPTWRELAEAHWIAGDLDAARRQIGAALQAPVLRPAERAERQRAAAEIELLGGRPQAALDALQPAIDRFTQRPGVGSMALQRARLLRAEAWSARGRRDEAQRALDEIVAWAGSRRSFPRAERIRSRALVALSALRLPGDPAAALRLAQQAQDGRSAHDAVLDDRLLWAAAQLAQAQALKAAGRHRQASATAAPAVDVLQRDQVASSPRLRQARALAGR